MTIKSIASLLSCLFLLLLFSGGARADDTEIFFNQSNSNVAANVLLILDTSGSMDDEVSSEPDYDASQTYPTSGGCSSSYYYFASSGTPKCTATNRIPVSMFKCASAASQLGSSAGASGQYSSTFIRWGSVTTVVARRSVTTFQWNKNLNITSGDAVECLADAGLDGDGSDTTNLYPSKLSDPTDANGIWGLKANSWWDVFGNSGTAVTFYSANYINYVNDTALITTQTKMKIMQDAIRTLLGSIDNVNVGLMRYDVNGAGGMVTNAMGPIATNATPVSNTVGSWAAAGSTPLEKTLYEAYLYFGGGKVAYGAGSSSTNCTSTYTNANGAVHCLTYTKFSLPSVAASRAGGSASSTNYDSPADLSCQKNYIIFLTDGQSNNNDTAIDKTIKALPSFSAVGGACDASTPPGAAGGLCLGALAQYMNRSDLRSDVDSLQNVTTFFIGFGDTFKTDANATAYYNYLSTAATRGGGSAYTATSLAELTAVFSEIFGNVQKINTTFSSPTVAVNAFNRTQTLNDLYVSVFSPKSTYHWPGNVKKYKLVDSVVRDVNGAPAVDPATGFLAGSSQSYWSSLVDGPDVTLGGASEHLPTPGSRSLFTYIGGKPAAPAALVPIESATNANLNIGGTGDPTRVDLINWARGVDVLDDNNDGSNTDTRHVMGDPIHAQPAVVIYGTGADDTVLYTPTNDGYLHATNAHTGAERWAFIPQEMLSKLKLLYADDDSNVKHYALDGQVTILKYDVNNNGIIDSGSDDRVFLFFGTGRNADVSAYYALDVTDPSNPKFVWSIGSSVLPDLGQAWSTPVLARINIAGATQNTQKLVLIIGGGYDPVEDGYTYVTGDTVGNHIYMVDALYGTLLWSAGGTGSTSNLVIPRMTHSIPSPITVMDLDGDGAADRMYVGDMAGQLWRFDIYSGLPASTVVTGGVIASLGSKEETTHLSANTRRFYSAPDAAAVANPGQSVYFNIAIGSGYRSHPLYTSVVDRLYSVRDNDGFTKLTQAAYATKMLAANLVLDSTLQDVTTDALEAVAVPNGSPGWKITLNSFGAGEKALVSATTFQGTIFYTTYSPTIGVTTNPCTGVGSGINRVYAVNVANGNAAFDKNTDGSYNVAERTYDLSQGGIAPSTSILINTIATNDAGQPYDSGSGSGGGNGPGPCVGVNCPQDPSKPTCLQALEVLGVCGSLKPLQKTYWFENQAN